MDLEGLSGQEKKDKSKALGLLQEHRVDRARLFLMKPTSRQNSYLKLWFSDARKTYNLAVRHVLANKWHTQSCTESLQSIGKKLNALFVPADALCGTVFAKLLRTPKVPRQQAVMCVVANLKTFRTNVKKRLELRAKFPHARAFKADIKFNPGYKTRKMTTHDAICFDARNGTWIDDTSFNLFPSWKPPGGKKGDCPFRGVKTASKLPPGAFDRGFRILYNYGKFHLMVTSAHLVKDLVEDLFTKEVAALKKHPAPRIVKDSVIFVDVGVRKFATAYSPEGMVKVYGTNMNDLSDKHLRRIRRARRIFNQATSGLRDLQVCTNSAKLAHMSIKKKKFEKLSLEEQAHAMELSWGVFYDYEYGNRKGTPPKSVRDPHHVKFALPFNRCLANHHVAVEENGRTNETKRNSQTVDQLTASRKRKSLRSVYSLATELRPAVTSHKRKAAVLMHDLAAELHPIVTRRKVIINRRRLKAKQRNKVKKARQLCRKAEDKAKNCMKDMHYKVSHDMLRRARTVVLPFTSSHKWVQSKTLPAIVKKRANLLKFGVFASRLMQTSTKYPGSTLLRGSEAYTTKQCGNCGLLDDNVKGKEQLKCRGCSKEGDRDVLGARNICLRFLKCQDHDQKNHDSSCVKCKHIKVFASEREL